MYISPRLPIQRIPFKEKIYHLIDSKNKITVVVIALICLSLCVICRGYFLVKKASLGNQNVDKVGVNTLNTSVPLKGTVPGQAEKIFQQNFKKGNKNAAALETVTHQTNSLNNHSTSGKSAFEQYKNDQAACADLKKFQLFMDVKSINSPHKIQTNTSVIGLMLNVSGLPQVDLTNHKCVQVVYDTLRYGNKALSVDLIKWLRDRSDFTINIIYECLAILNAKSHQGSSVDFYAFELLINSYKDKQSDEDGSRVNGQVAHVFQAMRVLIQELPNEDRIISLAEWLMSRKEFKKFPIILIEWMTIFQKKERIFGKGPIFYPLQESMMKRYRDIVKENPDFKRRLESKCDAEILKYIQSKEMN